MARKAARAVSRQAELRARAKVAPAKDKKAEAVATDTGAYLRALHSSKGVDDEDFALWSDPLSHLRDVTEWFSTGSIALDKLTGGGWPIGRIVELAAWEGVGKSTILDQSIAMAQRSGAITVLIESEAARDKKYSRDQLGVDPKKLIIAEAEHIEDGWERFENIINVHEDKLRLLRNTKREGPAVLVVWDSVGGMPAKEETEGGAGDAHMGAQSRAIKRGMRRIVKRLPDLRVSLVLANHFYNGIGMAGLQSVGGAGIRYYTSLRVWLSRTGGIKIGEREVGHVISARLKKTRIVKPTDPVDIGLLFGHGIDNTYTLQDWGKTALNPEGKPWITQKGGWYLLNVPGAEPINYQGSFVALGQIFHEQPALYSAMVLAYQGAI